MLVRSTLIFILLTGLGWAFGAQGATYTPPATASCEVDISAGWKFLRRDVSGASNPAFSDANWSNVDLPHTWNSFDGQDGDRKYYRGVGWYRKHFTLDVAKRGKKIFVRFDGANLAWISMELSIPNIMFRKSVADADLSFL